MDIKVTSNEVTTRLKSFFEKIPSNVNKELIKHSLSSGNLEDIFSLITQYKEPGRGNMLTLAELLNLYAQLDINKATALINQFGELDEVGLAGLQINGEVSLKPNCSCFIENCVLNKLSLRYTDLDNFLESLRTYVDLNNSEINVLRVALDTPTTFIKNPYEETEQQIRRWLISSNTKVNELQIVFK